MPKTSLFRRRIGAAIVDHAIAGSVSGVLVGIVLATRPGRPAATVRGQMGAVTRDALVMVLPAIAIGVTDDCSARFGGRTFGLEVRDRSGRRVKFFRAVVRNTVKNTPWQLAHIGVRQQTSAVGGRFGAVVGTASIVTALLAVVVDVSVLARTGRAIHDRASGTVVADLTEQPMPPRTQDCCERTTPSSSPLR